MTIATLRKAAARDSAHPAIIYRDSTLSYGELVERTEAVARGLASLKIGPGDRVALVHPNSPDFVVTFLATTLIGGVVVPLNPLYKDEELRHYFDDCQVRAVVTDGKRLPVCESALRASRFDAPALICTGVARGAAQGFESLLEAHMGGILPDGSDHETSDAVYQYSSGSTGRPKRVPRTHAQLRFEAESVVSTLSLTPADRISSVVPLFHTHGQGNCMLAALHSGATMVMPEHSNPFLLYRENVLRMLEREGVTVFPGVPFMFRMLAETTLHADLSSLRLCFSAGSGLPRETFDAFRRRFGLPVRQLYGCTEAGALTINLDENPTSTADSVGKPLNGVTIEITDEVGQPLPRGDSGEVAVRTHAMTRGYQDMDDLNREVFRDGMYFSGDLGRLDAEGRLWLTGRKKLFIEVVGNKVDPIEVEDVLVSHSSVIEAVVVGVPSDIPGEELVKAVVVSSSPIDEEELKTYCFQKLASFKVPTLVEFRKEIPKSPLGKVLRKYLV